MSGIKYLTVCNKFTPSMQECLKETPRRGGFFNWMFLFRGELSEFDAVDDFEKYDVVHVNGAPSDQILVQEIRNKLGKNSDTKIVFNNDHVCEVWDGFKVHPLHYLQAQRQADVVFGTEPYQTSNLIDGAVCMPHPHWTHMLKRWGRTEVNDSIGFTYHWWESKSFLPGMWSRKLKQDGIKHKAKLYSYMPRNDQNAWTKTQFDELLTGMDYPSYIESYIKNKVGVEYTGYHTYGRNSVDMAAIGMPMVGSDRVESMRRCFPMTAHDPCDGKAIVNTIKRLWTDDKFYQEVIDYSKEAVEYYNYKNAKERFMTALEDCDKKRV